VTVSTGMTMQALTKELFEPLGIEEENIEVLDVQNYQDYDDLSIVVLIILDI
jgi:hypothetical protein